MLLTAPQDGCTGILSQGGPPVLRAHNSCGRYYVREVTVENEGEVFLNSVPLLASLSREDRVRLLQALEEKVYERDAWVIRQARTFS